LPHRSPLSRRQLLAGAAVAGAALPCLAAEPAAAAAEPFGYCLNTATIRGHRLGLVRELEVAAEEGYGAVEPWIGSIQQYTKGGGSLKDISKRIADLGLKIPNAIGFARWSVDDQGQREKALEQIKREMDMLKQMGATGMAASPAGARKGNPGSLDAMAERYRAVLDLGDEMGMVPQLEIWGTSPVLSRLAQAVYVAMQTGHPKACVLPDVYHMFRGGSPFEGLALLGPKTMHAFHVNDYPAEPPREQMNDGHRIFPGDGIAPYRAIVGTLRDVGFRGWLSLELFNREYYKRPVKEVATTGLAKMKAVVRKALA